MLQPYVAVIERNKEGRFFAHLPDLPGATAAGASVGEVLRSLADIGADHLNDLAEEGDAIPEPTEFEDVPRDPEVDEYARAIVCVEVPGRSVKISLSIDEGLLARVDRAAKGAGLTRSGFFAEAAHQRLRQEAPAIVSISKAVEKFAGGGYLVDSNAVISGLHTKTLSGLDGVILSSGGKVMVLSDDVADHVAGGVLVTEDGRVVGGTPVRFVRQRPAKRREHVANRAREREK